MKTLVGEIVKRKNDKIKADAISNKKMAEKSKAESKKEQSTKVVLEEKYIAKEPETLMLDAKY